MPEFDWRSPDAYRPIQDITGPGFAWEFLRRSPDYRRDVKRQRRTLTGDRADDAFGRRWGLPFRGRPTSIRRRRPCVLASCGFPVHPVDQASAA